MSGRDLIWLAVAVLNAISAGFSLATIHTLRRSQRRLAEADARLHAARATNDEIEGAA